MTTADALPGDMPGLRAAALALIAERDELLRRVAFSSPVARNTAAVPAPALSSRRLRRSA